MKFLLIFILLIAGTVINAQDPPVQVQQQLEDLSEVLDEIPDDDQYLQYLDHVRKHPLNINMVEGEQLEQLKLLNPLQVEHLLKYRKIFGAFVSIYELQSIPHWDVQTIYKALPYLFCGPATSMGEEFLSRLGGEHTILLRMGMTLQRPRGYDTLVNNHYLGNRNNLLARYRYQYKNLLYWGVTGEKDAGEQFFRGAQSGGFDFYSFHVFIRNLAWVKSMAIGDYSLNLGQGLIQWNGMGTTKSAEITNIKRQSPVILPYRSAGEYLFNRGAAITFQKASFETTVFFSSKKISAGEGEQAGSFSSMISSGLHRNATEIEKRKKLGLQTAGASFRYRFDQLQVCLNFIQHRFSQPMLKKDEPYNLFAMSGDRLWNGSIDYSYTLKNIHLFGEMATNKNLKKAVLNGALISVDPRVDISLLYRYLEPGYNSLFGNAFTENSQAANENGFYAGISLKPGGAWQLQAFADYYSFPWLKYRVNAPSKGWDHMIQWNLRPNKQFELYIRYKSETKALNQNQGVIHYPSGKSRQSLRVHYAGVVNPFLELRSRVELVWYDRKGQTAEEGMLAYLEMQYKRSRTWGGNFRLQYFQTGGFNSRVYAFESDVLYSYSIPASSDEGFRYYINVHIKPVKKLVLWVRWAQSIYGKGIKETGSGLNLIPGNVRSDIKMQALYTL